MITLEIKHDSILAENPFVSQSNEIDLTSTDSEVLVVDYNSFNTFAIQSMFEQEGAKTETSK